MPYAARRRSAVPALVTLVALTAVLAASAAATERSWTGGYGGLWYMETNWNPAGYPWESDVLTIDSGSADASFGIGIVNGGTVTVRGYGVSVTTGTGSLSLAYQGTGMLSIRDGASVTGWNTSVCTNTGTSGTVEVTGYNSSLGTYQLDIAGSGTGTVTLSGGADLSSTSHTRLATDAGTVGHLSVTGSGSTLTVGTTLIVSFAGDGTVELLNGATGSANSGVYIAQAGGSRGTLAVSGAGSAFDAGTELLVGLGGAGALIVEYGATVTTDACQLGLYATGTGDARVEGPGSLLSVVGNLSVGGTDTSAATLDLVDRGEARVTGTTTVGAMGVLGLHGGKLVTPSLNVSGRFTYAAGTLQLTASGLTFGYNTPIGPTVTLNPGDLIDLSGTATVDLGASVAIPGGRLKAQDVVNSASIQVSAGGSVVVNNQVCNTGVLYIDNASVSAPNGILNDYGAQLIARGTVTGPLTNFGETFVTGTLSISGAVTSYGPILATNRPDTPLVRCGSLDNYGVINLAGRYASGDDWVTVPGTLATIAPTASLTNRAGGVIRGCSSISGRLTNDGGLVYADLSGTLLVRELTGNTLGGELRVADGSTINVLTTFTNDGEINLEGPGAALAGGAIANSGTLHGQGRVSNPLTNSGSIRVDAGILRLTGSLTSGPGALIEVESGATLFATQGLANNQGAIVLRDAIFDNNSRTMTNNGTITGCGTLRTGGLTNSVGHSIGVGGGDLDVIGTVHTDGPISTEAGCTTTFYSFVSGTGNFPGDGTVVFLAGYSPGDSPAEVEFGGDVSLSGANLLVMELVGTTPGAQYDVLDVAGNLDLSGTLDVRLLGGFEPRAGQAFDLFDWGTLSGGFAAVELPTLADGLAWDTSTLYTSGAIEVVPEPATLALLALGGLAFWRRRRNV